MLLSEIPSAIWLLLFERSKLVASHTPPNREHALPSIALIMMSRKPNVRAVNMLKGRLVPKQTQSALLHYLSASKLPILGISEIAGMAIWPAFKLRVMEASRLRLKARLP